MFRQVNFSENYCIWMVDHLATIDNASVNVLNFFGISEDDFNDYRKISDYFKDLFAIRD